MSWYHDVPRLPIIDLSLYEKGDPWHGHVSAQLDWAASEFGAFYVIGHGIETAVVDLAGSSSLSELPGLRQSVARYVLGITDLAQQLLDSLCRAVGCGASYSGDSVTGNPPRELRILDSSSDTADTFAGELFHPGGLLGLAYQSGDRGLQVEHATGWIDVPHVRGSFVVSIGERLETLTRARYQTVLHRHVPGYRAHGLLMSFLFGSAESGTLAPARSMGGEVPALGSLRPQRSVTNRPTL